MSALPVVQIVTPTFGFSASFFPTPVFRELSFAGPHPTDIKATTIAKPITRRNVRFLQSKRALFPSDFMHSLSVFEKLDFLFHPNAGRRTTFSGSAPP